MGVEGGGLPTFLNGKRTKNVPIMNQVLISNLSLSPRSEITKNFLFDECFKLIISVYNYCCINSRIAE